MNGPCTVGEYSGYKWLVQVIKPSLKKKRLR